MAFTYGFYNSQKSDRMYDATQVSELFDGLIRDGVFSSIGDYFATIPGEGLQVIVKTGRAWFDHTWNKLDTFLPLSIDKPDITLSRYDAVILEIGTSTRTNDIKIIKGVNSYNPVYPTLLNNDDVHQYPLAYVRVNNGATAITASNIEIMVGREPCPFVIGILETADINDMFNQWDGEFDDWLNDAKSDFDTWFANVQSQLEGDVAANLQRQIDQKVNISDKATASDMHSGANDTKYVTPKGVTEAINGGSNNLHQYCWKRQRITGYESYMRGADQKPNGISDPKWYVIKKTYGDGGGVQTNISVSDAIQVNQSDGTVTLVNPSTVTFPNNAGYESDFDKIFRPLRGKYITGLTIESIHSEWNDSTEETDVTYIYTPDPNVYYLTSTAYHTSWSGSTHDASIFLTTGFSIVLGKPIFETVYVFSSNRGEYPDNGDVGDYHYEYLGVPFDNAKDPVRIEEGYYAGSGESGLDHPNELTFSFSPKLLFVDVESTHNARTIFPLFSLRDDIYRSGAYFKFIANPDDSGVLGYSKVSSDRKTIYWYSSSPANQLNISGWSYHYLAIG